MPSWLPPLSAHSPDTGLTTESQPESFASGSVELKAAPGVETREVSNGINVDLDAEGNAVGFDIDLVSCPINAFT